jgi:glycosyltransferase involved in cell wall biosynthesis
MLKKVKLMNDLITIVTVTYNAEDLLEATILSIINQSYKNIEYIIIDGASTDKTIEIIKKYEDSISYWISEPDEGIYYAMNKAIKKASGKWINFMNAGDTFFDLDTVEYVMNHRSSYAELIYGNFQIKESGVVRKAWDKSQWHFFMPFCHQTLFTRTTIMKEELFDTSFKLAADHNFIIKMYVEQKIFDYIDKTLVIFTLGGFAESNEFLMNIESLKVLLDHKIPQQEVYQSHWYKVFSRNACLEKINYISDLEKKIINNRKTIAFKESLLKGKDSFIEYQKSIIDNQNKIIEKQDETSHQLFTLFHDIEVVASISSYKNPLKKYRSYKNMLSTYHRMKNLLLEEDLIKRVKKVNLNIEYTVISATYNVEKYLEDFFKSLIKQSLNFENHIHLIMIDDGSTDGSAEIIKTWKDRYPDNIFYYKKENGGAASARNFGLQFCHTKWVTFIDPDDFIDKDYFKEVQTFEIAHQETYLSMISCNLIFYIESDKTYEDTHPLKYRYLQGEKIVSDSDLEGMVQLATNSAFFRYSIIKKNLLVFDERVIPNFEDAHFVGKYLLSLEGTSVGFASNAKYYYRKRSACNSLLDTSWTKPELFDDGLKYGCLDLLMDAKQSKGYVPEHTQRTVLYHLSWFFKHIINHRENISFLTDEQVAIFKILLQKIFDYIDIQTIQKFNLSGLWLFHKIGLLGLYKETDSTSQTFIIKDYDEIKLQIKIHHIYYYRHNTTFLINGKKVSPSFSKIKNTYFLDDVFIYERILWIDGNKDDLLTIKTENMKTHIFMGGKSYGEEISLSDIILYFNKENIINPFTEKNNLIRENVLNTVNQRKYKDAWLLIDRDTQADDNAEHLYRYITNVHPEINAFFGLRRESHDWDRLEKDGFNLIEFDSYEYKLVYLYTKHLVSSHAENYIINYLPAKWDMNIPRTIYTFLQHGVIHNNLSNWLNSYNVDCFITTSKREYDSIVDDGTSYQFTKKEVVLTGLPRHDSLLSGKDKIENFILIIPTWRKNLMGEEKEKNIGNSKALNSEFKDSEYFKRWNSVLRSKKLFNLSNEYGYKIGFFPHANIQPYLDIFEIPNHIEVLSHEHSSIQDLFQRSALMITDYSSVAFEMGILQREVIYYQFDHQDIFNGKHTSQKGYFDYTKDGFGPVCYKEEEVMNELESFLDSGGKVREVYLERMQDFFEFHDTNNCQRVFETIQKLDSKDIES